ncbi:HtaA domain-containing protein [Nocardioides deserti]|uniref:HtaA domain-containing protein n=1 Tax=Nocardioides deserti TaxID=1588644 RepID=A0ABR6U9E6_9ACTN|nr:HtaA domain-containing protein [Nocardioides deserti]MBC2960995.1 HtaA domain-containing protein [Nocardioides deserti]GGO76045.1 hypothetical protein GCM10012276_27870 [Nocardioides deserti]
MRPERAAGRRHGLAAALASTAAVALLGGTVGGLLGAAPAVAEKIGEPPTRVALEGAVLRWGINHESSNRAHAPDTFNYLSAGRVADPGRGGTALPRSAWKQRAGAVRVQKWDGRRWRAATWAGLRTDASGAPLGSPASGSTSGLRFTIGEGEGYVDPAAGTARVAWDGDVTVVYYSGMSMFHLSDPELEVADGRGTLTATVSGYASSVDDPGSWAPVPEETVTLADLPDVDLGEPGAAGLTADPAYRGVIVDGLGQTSGDAWSGSFPSSFVAYMERLGTAAFWFSSGSSTDPFKVPSPLSVSYAAAGSDPGPTPTAPPTQPVITNPTIAPPPTPTATPPATTPATAPVAAPAPVVPPVTAPAAAPVLPAVPEAGDVAAVVPPATAVALPASTHLVATTAAGATTDARPATWPWWLGGACLLTTASLLLLPAPRRSRVA